MTYRQGNVVEEDVEHRGATDEAVADQSAHVFSLRDELTGVELGHDAFEHLVDDARQHAVIIVGAQRAVDLRQGVHSRPREHTTGDIHHLQVLGAGERGHVAGSGAHVVGDGRLEPGDAEVGAFIKNLLADAADARVLDGAVTSVDWDVRSDRLGGGMGGNFEHGVPLKRELFSTQKPPMPSIKSAAPGAMPLGAWFGNLMVRQHPCRASGLLRNGWPS